MKKFALPVMLFLGLVGQVSAVEGNAEAGKAKSATCAACHGPDGNSPTDMYPKIAGQHAGYIYKQLKEFKAGMTSGGKEGRNNAVMGGMVAALSDQDMKDLAVFYASQTMKSGSTPEDVVARGQQLFRAGDMDRGIAACIACHGPRGVGHSLANFPKISFQHPAYIKAQLESFRSGTRANDMNGMMRDIAKKLTDEDIEVLSKYLGGLH
ncbi:cytochrome C [Rheinheimera sp. SA_1]|jgi:cytochrome c553|uniref:c-type cytochrome n=1 Tax=Rheinheimera sp. SA_1 TaxID=1827365 RepID=UPI0007FBAAE7|nr:c-type cytochrome [Rheinheimera sp. SA_1]OBP13170.1 cytochrome C [Rheinheimera sp. SA_1]